MPGPAVQRQLGHVVPTRVGGQHDSSTGRLGVSCELEFQLCTLPVAFVKSQSRLLTTILLECPSSSVVATFGHLDFSNFSKFVIAEDSARQ